MQLSLSMIPVRPLRLWRAFLIVAHLLYRPLLAVQRKPTLPIHYRHIQYLDTGREIEAQSIFFPLLSSLLLSFSQLHSRLFGRSFPLRENFALIDNSQ